MIVYDDLEYQGISRALLSIFGDSAFRCHCLSSEVSNSFFGKVTFDSEFFVLKANSDATI